MSARILSPRSEKLVWATMSVIQNLCPTGMRAWSVAVYLDIKALQLLADYLL
jgi:hypothetical protein